VTLSESPFIKQINDFREKTLKLPKRKAGQYTYEMNNVPIPILYPISPFLFKEVDSWNDRVFLSGFFYLDLGEETLTNEVEEFLEKGKKPIVVSFSSMPLKNPTSFKQKLVQALKETDNRAIVLIGTSGMKFNHEQNILAVESAPHRLLFKRAKGIIHHGGVGTMSEALLSGVPQLIMPFTVDQPFWANRLYKKGYSIKSLREKNLKVSDLVQALGQMENKEYIENAQNVKKVLQSENGLHRAVKYIESILDDTQKG
jgi:sterol 3beta-glucosyltransferase